MPKNDFVYVKSPQELAGVVEALRRSPLLGFDTEFVGESTYEPVLCLVQLATAEGLWIVDPLAVTDLRPMWEALTEPGREVIALAAREEIRFCLRYAGRTPDPLFDPQIAGGLLGCGYPLSHTNLLKAVLGITVSGRETFTDWRQRPLSQHQLEYAADDVRYLLQIREELMNDAERKGRVSWIKDECHRLAARVVEAEQEERWWRVSGSTGLGRQELAVLRELWHWRDELARGRNVPPRRVMKDELLVEIAKRKPSSTGDLFALRGLDRGSLRDEGAAIVRAVETALQLPQSEWPKRRRRDDAPQLPVLTQILSVAANNLAAENQVDPALLATTADLQDLVRWKLNGTEGAPLVMQGWRGEILGEPLMDVLDGRRILRVGNLKSPNPLVFEKR